jgi:choline dehydrogenase-like flavoprotein
MVRVVERGVIERTGANDVIVVGGGTAGAVVAARLVEAGLRVPVVEAGPGYGSYRFGGWQIPSGQFRLNRDLYAGAGARATSASCSRTGRPSQ